MPVYKSVVYTLKKRGDSYQFNVQVLEDGKPKRIRQQYPTEDEARTAAEAAIDRAAEGMTATPPKQAAFSAPTLQRVYELLRDGRWKGSKGERTSKKNAEDCVAFLGGDTPIDKVSTERVDALITHLKDLELEPGTIRRKLAALSTIIKYAAERHWIKAVPLIDRSAAGKERKRLRFLSVEEEQDGFKFLREYASEKPGMGKEVADFFSCLIDTGLRLSENVNLKWSEVDADRIRLGFDNKGEEPRMVPMTERVKGIMAERRKARVGNERRVWPNLSADRCEYFWNLMREALGQTDDPDFVMHACRHTFASRLAMADVPLHVIKELGGWKTLEMVLRYAHLQPSAKTNAIAKMQAAVG